MNEYDEAVIRCFLKNQCKLYPEAVAESEEEAESFLEDCMAYVAEDVQDALAYIEEAGVDTEGMSEEELLEIDEIFEVGDGRYLIVEI